MPRGRAVWWRRATPRGGCASVPFGRFVGNLRVVGGLDVLVGVGRGERRRVRRRRGHRGLRRRAGFRRIGRTGLMRTRLWVSLAATTLLVLAAFAGNLVTGNTPLLGLDLQGGASVILEPEGDASGEDLTVVRDLI